MTGTGVVPPKANKKSKSGGENPKRTAPLSHKAASPEPADGFLLPVFRRVAVLQPVPAAGRHGLTVADSQKLGGLFLPTGTSTKRYLEGAEGDSGHSRVDRLNELLQKLKYPKGSACKWAAAASGPARPVLEYGFVPLVAMPYIEVTLAADKNGNHKESKWTLRETLTVCGEPSKSKSWMNLYLEESGGRRTDETPLDEETLWRERARIDPFLLEALRSFIDEFYLKVLNEDARPVLNDPPSKGPAGPWMERLDVVEEAEIAGIAADLANPSALFEGIENTREPVLAELVGGERKPRPGSDEDKLRQFLNWIVKGVPRSAPGGGYGAEPLFVNVVGRSGLRTDRALAISMGRPSTRLAGKGESPISWYGVLAPRAKVESMRSGRAAESGGETIQLVRAATRVLADEYGSCF